MLRLETKQNNYNKLTIENDIEIEYSVYDHKIREVLSHYPTGHYMSLISAYSSISVFDNIGSFSIIKATGDKLLHYDGSIPFKNLGDLQIRCSNKYVFTQITPQGQIEFKLLLPERQATYILNLSLSAAWSFGFAKTQYTFDKPTVGNRVQPTIRSDHKHIPITLQYLQIICKNVCGTNDSNMTMPTCLGIMHITNNFTLINPHIAINHRINEGRIIDIEILDQDNNPFIWKPVYLEFLVTESPEHEKRQGFFRLEKPYVVHLHEAAKMISIPEFFFYVPTYAFYFGEGASIQFENFSGAPFHITDKTINPYQDAFLQTINGKIITRETVLFIVSYLNGYIRENTLYDGPKPKEFLSAWFEKNELVLTTIMDGVTITSDILGIRRPDPDSKILILKRNELRVQYPSNIWYNKDSRINIYCREYHNRYPIVTVRRIDGYYQIINPVYWVWHELNKPTNELTFRAEEIITDPYGKTTTQPLEVDKDLLKPIFKLFYK
ncbi:Hypothetical protein GLP15_2182 [Giardia lamblia P15]|uniref:Uncharacterized protein n=1 Tax=Giardia intestinalis (strain P15) TaxID=658858 RepID=E1F6W8_GIAIA|nr:Hypothetical protein GLP15_2182 [Giardia lamblia P15]